jgi:hypothetical protein
MVRGVLVQGQVRSAPVIVGEIGFEQTVQVSLVEHDDVIQTLAPHRTDQPFDVRGLPRRVRGDADFLQAQGLGTALELQAVNPIAVPEEVLRGRREGEGFPELLGGPRGRGALDDIEVEDSATLVGKDDEDVKNLEGEGGYGKEIHRYHLSEVIPQESSPFLVRGTRRPTDHVLGDGSLRESDAQLEQLAVNPGSAPEWIGTTHFADEVDGV